MKIATFRMLAKMKKSGVKLEPGRLYYFNDVLDFLRERHNITITIYQDNQLVNETTYKNNCSIIKINYLNGIYQIKRHFNSYNEALKYGIEQALNYI
jgi:hypothetical protein